MKCRECGQDRPDPRVWRVVAWIKRRSGKTKPLESLPMTREQADREANELRAVGYKADVERVEVSAVLP